MADIFAKSAYYTVCQYKYVQVESICEFISRNSNDVQQHEAYSSGLL